ncbi:copper chaperone PCu(A)C [Sphingomonas sp.]|uniref:copper chaperone PCu(A)C n=1 Tax=Sphingomonas sp. TaxID=28214 RepID=UPI001D9733E5|nr:copper chaperone PCu(A)C [Sphingomonas sp.]MBX9797810.1 copper chaperone PCu(A)C [Sphingomonas sp.]
MTLILAAAAIALAGCGQQREIAIEKAYVRLPAVAGNPAAAYFTLKGGASDTRLLSVTSPLAVSGELHETMTHGGMTMMRAEKDMPLPAGATLVFAPGGKHVMLNTLNPRVKAGGSIPLLFTFANNLRLQYDAPVVAAGDPAP